MAFNDAVARQWTGRVKVRPVGTIARGVATKRVNHVRTPTPSGSIERRIRVICVRTAARCAYVFSHSTKGSMETGQVPMRGQCAASQFEPSSGTAHAKHQAEGNRSTPIERMTEPCRRHSRMQRAPAKSRCCQIEQLPRRTQRRHSLRAIKHNGHISKLA